MQTREMLDEKQLAITENCDKQIECEDCGVFLQYDEGSFYCNEKPCGKRGEEVEPEF